MAVNMAGVACRGLRCVGGCKNGPTCSFIFLNVFPITCFLGERRVWTVVQMVFDVVLAVE